MTKRHLCAPSSSSWSRRSPLSYSVNLLGVETPSFFSRWQAQHNQHRHQRHHQCCSLLVALTWNHSRLFRIFKSQATQRANVSSFQWISSSSIMHGSISVRLSPVVSLLRCTVFYIVSCTMFWLQFAMHIFFLCGCIAAIAGGSQKWFWSRIQCQSPPPSIVSTITNAIFSSKI